MVHVHFGMSGRFSTHTLPGPPPTATTRLLLVHEPSATVALLSAMTVTHGPLALLAAKAAQMGPDPLREDADCQRLWASMQRTRKAVGLVLMDQSMVAGIGNIYRAEILYKAGVHPEQPSNTLGRAQFDSIWRHSVELLQRGFASGSILTVDPGEPLDGRRRYIYNQAKCGRCSSSVRCWDMAARTAYACESCQPLVGPLSAPRQAALAKAAPPKLFTSHCAPDAADASLPPQKMTVAQLRAALAAKAVAHARSAAKPALLALLLSAQAPASVVAADPAPAGPVRTGTAHLRFASAAEAAAEKVLAGESAAVEHVALADDQSAAVRAAATKRAGGGRGLAAAFPQRKRAAR